jgi:hypothetical protein
VTSQRPPRPVIACNYKLVADDGVKANSVIVASKALATKATVAAAKARTPGLEDNIYDDDDDELNTPNTSMPLSTPQLSSTLNSNTSTALSESASQSYLRMLP